MLQIRRHFDDMCKTRKIYVHKSLSPAMQKKDEEATAKIEQFCRDRLLLQPLMNFATGLVSPSNVNIQKCQSVGNKIIETFIGKNPFDVKIPKKSLAVQMPEKFVIQAIRKVDVDLDQLLHRALCFVGDSVFDISLKDCLQYALCEI